MTSEVETEINGFRAENVEYETTSVDKQCSSIEATPPPTLISNTNELENHSVQDGEENFEPADISAQKIKRKKHGVIEDSSDSEEETRSIETNKNEDLTNAVEQLNEQKHKNFAIIDSDSEVEAEVTVQNKSFSDNASIGDEQIVFVTNSEGKLVPEDDAKKISQVTRLSLLCDPESSEEEDYANKNDEITYSEEEKEENEIVSKPNTKKSKTKKNDIEKPKKMTGKQAAELRKEIKSESQRMTREKNISLPYHKPKSYTLKEFLSRRPKFASAVPVNLKAPPSVAIKMSAEQLTLVSERLKEREKELKQFYKSESESEDERENKDDIPPSETEAPSEDNIGQPSENTNEESRKIIILENISIIPNSVEDGDIEEKDVHSLESATDSVSFMDCNIIKDADTNDVLVDATAEKEQEPIQTPDDHDGAIVAVAEKLNESDALPIDFQENCVMKNVEEHVPLSETTKINEENTMDYEFNLDGLEENTETVEEQNCKEKDRPEYTDLDKEIENFGANDTDQSSNNPVEQPKPLTKLDLIKESISNIKPKLSGNPNDVIDLETGIAKPHDVTKLMERFLEHNFKKPVQKDKVELKIISFESGEIHKETVAMKLDDEETTTVVEEKPGVKLKKLRSELQNQMAQKRSEWWQKKSTKQENNEENTYEGEKDECGLDDEILDDEEEEMEMSESSEEEEEEDEENYSVNEREKKKSMFVDEEAEESDEEGDGVNEAANENEEDSEAADDEGSEADDEAEIDDLSGNENETNEAESEIQNKSKTYRKILKGFTDDSDEEDIIPQSGNDKSNKENTNSQGDDDMPPPYQQQTSQTPVRQITQNKPEFEFLTPISYLTGLQNLQNSSSKELTNSPITASVKSVNEPSPLKEANWQQSLQKRLFADSEITDSQVEELCSGKFPETQNIDKCVEDLPCTSNTSNDMEHLVELCSGKFPSTAELADRRLGDQNPTTQDILNICTGGFTGITDTDMEESSSVTKDPADTYLLNKNNEVKSLGEDQDLIISQLIDEEEMEKFKKKFESPVLSNTQRRIVEEFQETMAGGGIIDSDDDTDTVGIKRKNKKRIMFSDDEDSADESKEEVIDLHDDIDEENENSDAEIDAIAYDSEENEIELVKDGGANLKPSDFFENEAELSESEWGSADEDEKDLDTLEFEQGDTEKYDEKKIRSDLEKIHMRRLLDDDTRQVKLLQEMLLEDGELHGTGRERQFRWKNIDSVDETGEGTKEEDDIYVEEEESEEQWRKRRHEREMFLKEKLKKSQETDDDDLLSGSQLLKIGQKVLRRSQSNSLNNTPVDKTSSASESPVLKQSFTLLNKRGSFLSRGDQVLQRLAVYNKQTSAILGTATAKNSRNFLFQSVSVKETSVVTKEDKKRKAADGTPNAIKKLRLSENFSPAAKKKPNAKARLFGNW